MATTGIIHTPKGDMRFELYDDATPNTVKNFVSLIQSGFYDDAAFHRVIPGFVAQGGCPHKTGTGGPGYRIRCEVTAPKQKHVLGALSMAHAGRDTGGSQFFIVLDENNTKHLDGNHTVFGKLVDAESIAVSQKLEPMDSFSVELTFVEPETEARELEKL